MCEPTTIAAASFALTAASTVSGVIGEQQAAKQQAKYNAQQTENYRQAERDNLARANLQQSQLTQQAGQKINQNNLEARKAIATARVSAGEAGVTGLSLGALLRDLSGQQAGYNDSVMANTENAYAQVEQDKRNIQTQTRSDINSLKPVQRPDYLGAAFKIGGAVNSYYNPDTSKDDIKAIAKALKQRNSGVNIQGN